MKTQHAPTPWQIGYYEDDVMSKSGLKIFSTKTMPIVGSADEIDKANAEFIVRAVNDYEKLHKKIDDLEFKNDLLEKALAMADKKTETTLGQYKALEKENKLLSDLVDEFHKRDRIKFQQGIFSEGKEAVK